MVPDKVTLSSQIIRVFSVLSLVTFLITLGLLIQARLSLGSGGELRELAGADFFEHFGLWLAAGSLLFGLAGLKVVSGLKAARRWAWLASLVLGVILVCLFPLGTIFGLKLMFDLFSREVKDWFRHPENFRGTSTGQGTEAHGLNLDLIRQLEERNGKSK